MDLAAMIVSFVHADSVESIAIVELAYVNARAGRPARDKRGQGHLRRGLPTGHSQSYRSVGPASKLPEGDSHIPFVLLCADFRQLIHPTPNRVADCVGVYDLHQPAAHQDCE